MRLLLLLLALAVTWAQATHCFDLRSGNGPSERVLKQIRGRTQSRIRDPALQQPAGAAPPSPDDASSPTTPLAPPILLDDVPPVTQTPLDEPSATVPRATRRVGQPLTEQPAVTLPSQTSQPILPEPSQTSQPVLPEPVQDRQRQRIRTPGMAPSPLPDSPDLAECWVRDDASQPFKMCKPSRFPDVCRNGGYPTEAACCSQGGAYIDGCFAPPEECWVPESDVSRTCIVSPTCVNPNGDPSKIFESEEVCCARGVAFSSGCAMTQAEVMQENPDPCWVRDSFYPAKTCRQSYALCSGDGNGGGFYDSQAACCAPGSAFTEGCDAPLPTMCWIVDEYNPSSCRNITDRPWVCLRGWGTFDSEDACCAGSFGPGGCQVTS